MDEESDGSAVDASQDDLNLVGALVDQDAIDAQAAEQEGIDAEMLERLEKSQWDGLEELEDIIEVRGYDPRAIGTYFWRHPGQLARRTAEVIKAITTIGALLNSKRYEDLVPTIEKLGPTYVKFGQALASRADLVVRSSPLSSRGSGRDGTRAHRARPVNVHPILVSGASAPDRRSPRRSIRCTAVRSTASNVWIASRRPAVERGRWARCRGATPCRSGRRRRGGT